MPIDVPPFCTRETDLPRIVHAYAEEALSVLSAPASSFSDDDHRWVMQSVRSLWDIEKATLRIVALNITRNLHQAAQLLGLSDVSLSRWIERRRPLPIRAAGSKP
jgi:transcriptional regulator with GAF, ATPase, and Fis domain